MSLPALALAARAGYRLLVIADRRWLPLLSLVDAVACEGIALDGPEATALFGDGAALTATHPLHARLAQAARILVFRRNATAAPLPLLTARFGEVVRHIASPGILERACDFPGPLWARLAGETARALDLPPPDPSLAGPFLPPAAAAARATAILAGHGLDPAVRPFLLVPFTGMRKKDWPLECWQELAHRLRKAGQSVLVLVDPERAFPRFPCPLVRERELPVLAALAARAALVVGGDTGLLQLAALCGTRCLMLFGPSDPALWTPPGAARVLRTTQHCAPCSADEAHHCTRECLDFTVDAVLAACSLQ